jgi:hypothetical protein
MHYRQFGKMILRAAPDLPADIRRAVLVLIALLPLFSALITSYHYHNDFKSRTDCAVCKSASDLSSGSKQETLSVIPPESLELNVEPEAPRFSENVLPCSLKSRAPPA